jgi:carbon-monoxide dehydrogenase large subunit
VAVVVAETYAKAETAAELIEIDYKELPMVVAMDQAIKPGELLLFETAPNNLCFDWHLGDKAAVDAAYARPSRDALGAREHPAGLQPEEPRAAIVEYDRTREDYTLCSMSQAPHVPEHKLRVMTFPVI